jgi:DNA-binding transcriptional ArsR family regulator
MIDVTTADRIAVVMHALGESTRLLILRDLVAGGLPVGEIAATVKRPVVNVSHHLGILRNAGVLTCERRGRQRIYALNPDLVSQKPDGRTVLKFDGVTVVLTAPAKEQNI